MIERKETFLHLNEINTFYGLSHILFNVSLQIQQGEILCLLGRNGAGKTTTIRSIAGLNSPKTGNIIFDQKNISKWPPHLIAKSGIICSFSEKRVFGELTVRENLEIGRRKFVGPTSGQAWNLDNIYELFPVLKNYEKRWAGTLSGGEQQMLCVARALMGNPRVLLLDEPTMGLAPVIVEKIKDCIKKLKKGGISILITEQNVQFAMELGERCYILDVGEVKFRGSFSELSKNEDLVNKYLAV